MKRRGLLDAETSGQVTAPRRASVRGTPHHLAYINDEERALLRARGGGVTEDGGQLLGPAGVPAFDGGDTPPLIPTQAENYIGPKEPDYSSADRDAWRAAMRAPIDQGQRSFVSGAGGGAPAGPVAGYNYGSFPTAPPTIGAMQPLPSPPAQAAPGPLPPVPNVGLPSYAPPLYGMQPDTLARLQQVGVMPRFGAGGAGPDFSGLLGRMR